MTQPDISLEALRALLDLLGDLYELRSAPSKLAARVAEGLCAVIGSDGAGAGLLLDFDQEGRGSLTIPVVAGPRSGRILRAAIANLSESTSAEPAVEAVRRLAPTGPVTFRRCDLVSQEEWERSAYVRALQRDAALGDVLYSGVPLPEGRLFGVALWRERTSPMFSEAERDLVQTFQARAARVYAHAFAGAPPDPLAELDAAVPVRCRSVLRGLMAGLADKEIAQGLGLSLHTVHEYVKDVYGALGVTGRVELLARLIAIPPAPAPALPR
jgi:DNA-binding CsgD family transcriptional regulator